MEYEALYAGQLVFLANCKVTPEGIYYGFGHYSSGTPNFVPITTGDGQKVMTIEVPDEVKENNGMFNAFGDFDGPNFVKKASVIV